MSRPRCAAGWALVLASLPFVAASGGDAPATREWSRGERARIRSLWIERLPPVPADPSNRVAGDPAAAALGQRLFLEPRLSANGEVRCATCHDPRRHFTSPERIPKGIGPTRRHAPSLVGSAYSPWLYWDGRRDSAWAQALVPLENAAEMGSTRTRAVRLVAEDPALRGAYEAVLGGLPDAEELARLPPSAGPLGTGAERRAWAAMSDAERRTVDVAFANLGKSLAAYGRTLVPAPARFDRYVAALERGEDGGAILAPDEVAGLALFVGDRAGCLQCHNGPLLTNHEFHNIGTVPLDREPLDLGRRSGLPEALADPFNCLGPYSDAPRDACMELVHAKREGGLAAFKVPSLRHVADTAPYMHDGQLATLEKVLAHYVRAPRDRLGHQELRPLDLTPTEQHQLVRFLETLR